MANPMTLSRLQSIVGMSSLKNDFVLRIGKDGDGIEVLPDPKGAGLKGWENQAIRQAVLDSLSTSEGRKNMALHFSAAKHEQVFSAFLTSKENCGKNLTVGDVRALLNTLESVQKLDEVNASYYDKQSPVRTRQVQKVDKPAYMKQAPGWNTCWLFSVLNAMQSTPAGRKYCRQIITDRTLTFYDDQFKPHQYKNWKKAPSKFRGMSKLECAAMHHVQKYGLMSQIQNTWKPGEFGYMEGAYKCLGLVPSPMPDETIANLAYVDEKGREEILAAEITQHLDQGDFVTFNENNTHFWSVIGVERGKKGTVVKVISSTDDDPKPKTMSLRMLLSKWPKYNVDGRCSSFYFLRLRSACEKDIDSLAKTLDKITEADVDPATNYLLADSYRSIPLQSHKDEFLAFLRSPNGYAEVTAWRNKENRDLVANPFDSKDWVLDKFASWLTSAYNLQ